MGLNPAASRTAAYAFPPRPVICTSCFLTAPERTRTSTARGPANFKSAASAFRHESGSISRPLPVLPGGLAPPRPEGQPSLSRPRMHSATEASSPLSITNLVETVGVAPTSPSMQNSVAPTVHVPPTQSSVLSTQSFLLIATEGIEPPPSVCKADILPLDEAARYGAGLRAEDCGLS